MNISAHCAKPPRIKKIVPVRRCGDVEDEPILDLVNRRREVDTTDHNVGLYPKDMKIPESCVLEGPIKDPRPKKRIPIAEREHVAHFHSTYGGSVNLPWFNRLNLR